MRARVWAIASTLAIGVLGLTLVGWRLRAKPGPVAAPQPVPRPTPTPPALSWSSPSEEQWLVGEVARDLLEMIVYAKSPSGLGTSGLNVAVASLPGADAQYEVAAPIGPEVPPFRQRIVLQDHVWAPTNYESLVVAAIDRLQMKAVSPSMKQAGTVLGTLVDLKPETIERENKRVSAALEHDMLSAAAHEEAAVVLGAFALRENAGTFSDARLALCRMTAHLALAKALRPTASPGAEGEYARLIQTTLIGREGEAVDQIARLRRGKTTPGQRAWLTALGMRNTGDFRLANDPTRATRLERIEHFRALKRSQGGPKALEFLSEQRIELATEWTRIGLNGVFRKPAGDSTVEEGNTFAPSAVGLELQELASVWKLAVGSPLNPEDDPTAALNSSAGRTVWHPEAGDVGPRVIDRGLWAAFAQRHVLSAAERTESHLQDMLGDPAEAAAFRAKATTRLAKFTQFPLLEEIWHRRPLRQDPGGPPPPIDKDRGRCVAALDLVRRRPDVVVAYYWDELNAHCFRAQMENTVVDPKLWFTRGLPMGTLYDLEHRSYIPALGPSIAEIENLAKLAPYDKTLMFWRFSRYPLESKIRQAEFDSIFGAVAAYDAKAQGVRATRLDVADALFASTARQACEANADQCLRVAREFVHRGLVTEGVHAYERAVEGARDRVAVSNATRWLVQHYFEEGLSDRALEVANMSAGVGSAEGLDALGQLLERLGRYEEAESTYRVIVGRYPDEEFRLLAFYLRHERRMAAAKFHAEAAAAEKKLFAGGMKATTIADLGVPIPGPGGNRMGFGIMEVPSKDLQALGVRFGDVVLVIDGYRVINQFQYSAILWLTDQPEVTMIVWREGKNLVELKGPIERRRYGPREPARAASSPSP